MNALIPFRYKDKFPSYNQPHYDDVVDRTDFKIGQDSARNQRLGDTGGSLGDGVYDFDGDEPIDMHKISNAEIALRSGALDKADVDTLARVMKDAAKNEADKAQQEKLKKEQKDLDNARQSFLDRQTGFNQEVGEK